MKRRNGAALITENKKMSLIMLNGYLEAMLWSSSGTDADGEDLESLEGFEISLETIKNSEAVCVTFFAENQDLIAQVMALRDDYDLSDVGHDFWLTRNGHGAGFWDRGDDPAWDELSDKAKEYGEAWPYVGDDGKVYL